jgi:dTDP-glucose pyrophosphorylase
MKYKVCILAAGVGTRMSPLTDKINKSLLPVDFKAVLSHIIEKFDPEVEIVIAVGHLKETIIDYLECAYSDRTFTIVEVDRYTGEGSGPGYSLMQCKRYLDSPFIFFASDTVVLEDIPPPSENWLGVSAIDDSEPYCTAEICKNRVVGLEDKTINDNENAFIGLAGINAHEVFFDALEKNNEIKAGELQVSNGFSALIGCELVPEYFTWHDTGNMEGYTKANEAMSTSDVDFDFSKKDEFLYFVGNNVIKFFADETIIRNRHERALILGDLCPTISVLKKNFYSYKMVSGEVLYDVIDDGIMEKLLAWLDENLWVKVSLNSSQLRAFKLACSDFYYKKTIKRLKQYHERHSLIDEASSINGVTVPSIEELFNSIDWADISIGIPSNFHGDLQFDNVLLKNDSNFLLLDWRQDFSGFVDYGDQYYDFAKLNGGMKVSYKLIKQGHFSYSKDDKGNVKIEHKTPEALVTGREKFITFLDNKGIDMCKVNILTSLIYLNMSPMHNEPFDHFIYNLGKLNLYRSLIESGKLPAMEKLPCFKS